MNLTSLADDAASLSPPQMSSKAEGEYQMVDRTDGEFGLDHILWAVPNLEAGASEFAKITGVTPDGGGSHVGFGTRNTLASLGDRLYFEVISVDPAQDSFRDRAERISKLTTPEMHTFGIRGSNLEPYRDAARALGLEASDPVAMGRVRADGVKIQWRSIYISDPVWGGMLPFLIDWMGSQHPAETTPGGCSVKEFCALHPNADELRDIYSVLNISVPVKRSTKPGFLLVLDTPNGEVVLV